MFSPFSGKRAEDYFFGKFIPLGSKAGVGHKVFRGNLDSVFAENKTLSLLDLWRAQCPEMKFGNHLKSVFLDLSAEKKRMRKTLFQQSASEAQIM